MTDVRSKFTPSDSDKASPATEDSSMLYSQSVPRTVIGVVNEGGQIVDDEDRRLGDVENVNDLKPLVGQKVDSSGSIISSSGEVLGQAHVDVEDEDTSHYTTEEVGKQPRSTDSPSGSNDDSQIGPDDQKEAGQDETEVPLDYSTLQGTKVNKIGNLVNSDGDVMGHVIEGVPKEMRGMTSDENGDIWDEYGKKVGKGEPVKEEGEAAPPFEDFPDATIEADGAITSEGRKIGVVVDGDLKVLKGGKVDADGDILDRSGNTVGRAERWEEPEAEEEIETPLDNSVLEGQRVNKAGNIVNDAGNVLGHVIEGDVSKLVGRMCDKDGNIWSEGGEILGRGEVLPESERESAEEGPFTGLNDCSVAKDGKILTASGDIVGRLIAGDPQTLLGRSVDEDGDIVDRNGNVIGRAERWEEPEVERVVGPMAGRKVHQDGTVMDEDGNIMGKLIDGDPLRCSGKEVDDDGDILNSKGETIGHVVNIDDIPPEPEPKGPEESIEDKQKREQTEKDRELTGQIAFYVEQALDKIKPICKRITDRIDQAERTPKEDLDEEELVKQVRPLIEEGGNILSDTNGAIRGMDPDGRLQRNAKHKAATRDATPEEFHLSDMLKELTGTVSVCIEDAKRKLESMPHAKDELSPLWALLANPLGQIVAAVGLLLSGLLGLVGQLLGGLGLGKLLDPVLGGLGLSKIFGGKKK